MHFIILWTSRGWAARKERIHYGSCVLYKYISKALAVLRQMSASCVVSVGLWLYGSAYHSELTVAGGRGSP